MITDRVVVLPLLVEALDSVGKIVRVEAEIIEDTIVDVPVTLYISLVQLHPGSSYDVVLAEGLVVV